MLLPKVLLHELFGEYFAPHRPRQSKPDNNDFQGNDHSHEQDVAVGVRHGEDDSGHGFVQRVHL